MLYESLLAKIAVDTPTVITRYPKAGKQLTHGHSHYQHNYKQQSWHRLARFANDKIALTLRPHFLCGCTDLGVIPWFSNMLVCVHSEDFTPCFDEYIIVTPVFLKI